MTVEDILNTTEEEERVAQRKRDELAAPVYREWNARRVAAGLDPVSAPGLGPLPAKTNTPWQRVTEWLAATGKLAHRDFYDILKLHEIDHALWKQYLGDIQAAVRGLDDPGEALHEMWRTVLTHIVRRAAEVNRAGDLR